jgi:hypothetical protein
VLAATKECRRALALTVTSFGNHGNIIGRRVEPDIRVDTATPGAYVEISLSFSHQPTLGGPIILRYRFDPSAISPTYDKISKREWAIRVPTTLGQYQTHSLVPIDDIARLFPGIVAADNSLCNLEIGGYTGSAGGSVRGFVDTLRLPRDTTGAAAFDARRAITVQIGQSSPDLAVHAGLEFSKISHINGLAPNMPELPPGSGPITPLSVVEHIKNHGGVATYNHPFGTADGQPATPAEQEKKRVSIATKLISARVYGADVIEIGYNVRGGATLATHLALAEDLWANGIFITANGVSDNHVGTHASWITSRNRFTTVVYGASTNVSDQLAGLRAGNAFVSLLGSFKGEVMLSVDNALMGSVLIDPTSVANLLTISATDIPIGGKVDIVRCDVDYSGAASTGSSRGVILRSVLPYEVTNGNYQLSVASGTSCVYYLKVYDGSGAVVAFTNPVWVLKQESPTHPVPNDRKVA